MKTVLSIAGTDPTGGAGIQADIKTITMNGCFAMSAVTALVAQNTFGVKNIAESSPSFLEEQLDAVFEDIFPHAIKIGMVSSSNLVMVIAERLRRYKAQNIVVDPVMVATAGSSLIKNDGIETLSRKLIPLADIVTPNISEGEILSETRIYNREDMEKAATVISKRFGCAVLLKGGHNVSDASDLLCKNGHMRWFEGKRINNPNTHGTGCTLSSAIASCLAKGYSIEKAVESAKTYVSGALSAMLDLGHGRGPLKHNFSSEFLSENT